MLQPIEIKSLAQAWPPADCHPWPGLEKVILAPGQALGPGGGLARLEPGPKGLAGLSLTENGRTVRLASAVDPRAEDRALVRRLNLNQGEGLLCLGLGLGYHLDELASEISPETPLWVLESRPELAACALMSRDFSHLFARPGFRLFVGPFDGPPWAEGAAAPTRVFWRPATYRHFAAEYPIKVPTQVKRPAKKRLLLFQSGYFLDRELKNAADALGRPVAVWDFQAGQTADDRDYRRLLESIKSFSPEMILTGNHLGFDAEGMMDDLLGRLGIPAASWFVDSPAFILGRLRPGRTVKAFSWDRDYIPMLESRGFDRVAYLPLATDENFFHPSGRAARYSRNLAFVGDSLTGASGKYLAKVGLSDREAQGARLLAEADQLAESFLTTSALLPPAAAVDSLARDFDLAGDDSTLMNLSALVTWRASRLWRLKVLGALPWADLTVAGDRAWGPLLGLGTGRLLKPLDYYRDLANFYRGSRVNINITSAQMKTGLNQRVFDVPAAGAFLLTDYRAQLEDVFEPGREVIAYHDPAEARDLARWYADRQPAREKVTRAARARVMGGHLYSHRLAAIIKEMGR